MGSHRVSVLHFLNTRARGGVEQHVLTLLRGLDRKYFRLHLVCGPEIAESMRRELPADVEVLGLALRKPTDIAKASRFAQIVRQRRVDVLHSHLFFGSRAASPIGWACRVPVIIETPHIRESWRRGIFKDNYVVDRACGCFVDRYIAVSYANAAYLKETKRLPERKIVVIQNGCDAKQFRGSGGPDFALKRSFGFRDDCPVLLVPGRLELQKGHAVLFDALPTICREFPSVRVICVGEGSLRQQLEAQVSSLGLQDAVRFVGFQSNMEDWFSLADITVLPSFFEGLPLVAIESLAACRTVVASAVDGTPEVVVNGETGLTVPPGDPDCLAIAISKLLRDQNLRQRFAQVGRERVMELFTQEGQIRKTQELYLSELNARGHRIDSISVSADKIMVRSNPAQVLGRNT